MPWLVLSSNGKIGSELKKALELSFQPLKPLFLWKIIFKISATNSFRMILNTSLEGKRCSFWA